MAIIDTRGGAFQNLPQTLLQMLVNKEQIAQQKETQKLNRDRFEFEQEQAQAAEAQALRDRQNQIAGARGLIMLMGQGPQEVAATLPEGSLPIFAQGAGDVLQQNVAIRGAQSDVRVSEATERTRILKEFAQTEGMTLQNALMQANLDNDPARVRSMWDMMLSGQITAGQAADANGLKLPPSISRDFKLNPLAPAGSGGEAAAKAASLYESMSASNATINRLVDEGVALGLMESWHRSSTNFLTSWISGIATDEKERTMIQAMKSFADSYRFFISGQQSSDKEAERLLFTMLENPGDFDKPEVISQKRFMRRLTINMAQQVARGQLDSATAARRILDTAIEQGLPEAQINVFREQYQDALDYAAQGGHQRALTISQDGGSLERVPSIIDTALGR